MQFQADISGVPVIRRSNAQTTAAGAALLAGIGAGMWTDPGRVPGLAEVERQFDPMMEESRRAELRDGWKRAVAAAAAF